MLFFIIMAVLQGIAEFLPISSSLHLLVASRVLNAQHPGDVIATISVFLNLGTLAALLWYYRIEVNRLFYGAMDLFRSRTSSSRALLLNIITANLPTIIVFGVIELCFGGPNFSSAVTFGAIVIFSLIIFFCDKFSDTRNTNRYPTSKEWIIVGIAQVMSIIPGVSRLGVTLSAFRLLSFNRTDSFKYSMLLSIPPVVCANLVKDLQIILRNNIDLLNFQLISGILISFIFGLGTLWLVNRYIEKHTFSIFVLYRLIFASCCFFGGVL